MEHSSVGRSRTSPSAGDHHRAREDRGGQQRREDPGLPSADGGVHRERSEEIPDHSTVVSGNLLKEGATALDKSQSDDNNNEINKDSIDRNSGYYDQFTIRRGASVQQKESFNPATECRCIATRTGDRTCPTNIKEWESRCWRIREKKGPGPAILDLPGPQVGEGARSTMRRISFLRMTELGAPALHSVDKPYFYQGREQEKKTQFGKTHFGYDP